jgi:hypothetical protein
VRSHRDPDAGVGSTSRILSAIAPSASKVSPSSAGSRATPRISSRTASPSVGRWRPWKSISGWASCMVCGQQHAALKDESIGVGGLGEPGQEPFECIELMKLVSGSPTAAGQRAEIEIGATGGTGSGRASVVHKGISNLARMAGTAEGNACAICKRVDGCAPGRDSRRRKHGDGQVGSFDGAAGRHR